MRTNRFVTRLGLVALTAVAIGACSPDGAPSAPGLAPSTPRSTLLGTVSQDAALAPFALSSVRRARALPADVSTEAVIGARGGRLELPAAGLVIDVPAGAVAATTTFRVTALAGEMLAYEFSPSGSTFAVPLSVTQDLRSTNVSRLPKNSSLRLAYFTSPTDADGLMSSVLGAGLAQETRGTLQQSGRAASFPVPHFSGWIIHWRLDGTADSTEVR
jgi:hypothetical protein